MPICSAVAPRRATARRVRIDPRARRDALIAAAERVFVQQGYHAATMDQIAAAAGISKRTLYQLVSSKEQLFTDLLARRQQAFDFQVETENRPIEDVLFDLLIGWAGHILSAKAIALTRLIMVDYLHGKTLSRILNRESAKPCRDALIAYLAECHASGRLTIHDPDEIANMLYGMTIGLRQRVHAAVALFLRGTASAYSPDNSRRR
ncbi:MAG: hypothetical protein B7X48_10800 [Acidiphilium sp. 34-60-192]|nr:MAG: hypothetical protein B7X48_10800 [Acidiphilium sp. 34-60-192]